MPFLKFSRDKRGYENYYLFDGKGRPRLLFWFRTPPQVKVGRAPFSDDVRKMVEAQNPGVHFDWARIMATPIPSPDVDHWRERRRVEKAAKRAAREADAAEAAEAAEAAAEAPVTDVPETAAVVTAPREDVEAIVEAVHAVEAETPAPASDVQADQSPGHRRRRRRRRGRGGGGRPATQAGATTETPARATIQDTTQEPGMPPDDEV